MSNVRTEDDEYPDAKGTAVGTVRLDCDSDRSWHNRRLNAGRWHVFAGVVVFDGSLLGRMFAHFDPQMERPHESRLGGHTLGVSGLMPGHHPRILSLDLAIAWSYRKVRRPNKSSAAFGIATETLGGTVASDLCKTTIC